jgi:hypothetical protein
MSGCVVILVDESEGMKVPVARTTREVGPTKSETVATAVNSLLNKLTKLVGVDLAVVGYRESDGNVDVGCRWGGRLAGREFVRSDELAGATLRMEQRTRRVPGPLGPQEERVDFPVWYEPVLGATAPQVAALEYCKGLLDRWAASSAADTGPLVVNIWSGVSEGRGNPHQAVKQLQELQVAGKATVVMQGHLASHTKSDALPPILYPADRAYLASGPIRDLFDRSSLLPEEFIRALKQSEVMPNKNARGMIYNGKMLDLTRLLSLVYAYAEARQGSSAPAVRAEAPAVGKEAPAAAGVAEAKDESLQPPQPAEQPAATAAGREAQLPPGGEAAVEEQAPAPVAAMEPQEEPLPAFGPIRPDKPAVVAFVVDRSSADPSSEAPDTPCARLVAHLGEAVGRIGKLGCGAVDVAVVSYGRDAVGNVDVRDALEGALAGRHFVRDTELDTEEIPVQEFIEERDNGIGRIMKIPHRRVQIVQIEPTAPAPAAPAFSRLAELLSQWCRDNPDSAMPPIVLHLTRGQLDEADARDAVAQLGVVSTAAGPAVVYHLVETDAPGMSVSYPDNDAGLEDAGLRVLWELSSPLLGREELAEQRPHISRQSRGLVVNGVFDQLLSAIRRALEE